MPVRKILLSGSFRSSFDGSLKGALVGAILSDVLISKSKSDCPQFFGHCWSLTDCEKVFLISLYPGIILKCDKPIDANNILPIEVCRAIKNDVSYPRVSAESLLSFAKSRSEVVKLCKKYGNERDEEFGVLIARWDIGYRGSRFVNTPLLCDDIYGKSLILPLYSDSSYGSADMWFWGSWKYMSKFDGLEKFFENTIKNMYQGILNDTSKVRITGDSLFGSFVKKVRNVLFLFGNRELEEYISYFYNYSSSCRRREHSRKMLISDINNHYLHKLFLKKKFLPVKLVKSVQPRLTREGLHDSFLLAKTPVKVIGSSSLVKKLPGYGKYFVDENQNTSNKVYLYGIEELNINHNFSIPFLRVLVLYISFKRHIRICLIGQDIESLIREHEDLPGVYYGNGSINAQCCFLQHSQGEVFETLYVSNCSFRLGESNYMISPYLCLNGV